MKFQNYKDNAGEYRWRLVANNGKIIADSGEGYTSKADAQSGVDLVKRFSSTVPVEDLTRAAVFGARRW